MQVTINLDERQRVQASYLDVIGYFERDVVGHLNAFRFDVIHHQLCQRLQVRRDQCNSFCSQGLQAGDECAGAGHDRNAVACFHGDIVQFLFGFSVVALFHAHDGDKACIAQNINARVD